MREVPAALSQPEIVSTPRHGLGIRTVPHQVSWPRGSASWGLSRQFQVLFGEHLAMKL
jgi:hypothetical protein